MSTHVIGFVPPDAKWKKMKAIWDSCGAAGIAVPKEVDDFFGGEAPDERGVEKEIPYEDYSEECKEGFEIEVDKIPKDVKVIRFVNSY